MNKYYRTLELHKITNMLSEKTSNSRTAEMAAALEPSTDIDTVKRELKKTSDAFDLTVKSGSPPFYNFKDVRDSLKRAMSGASLTLKELLDMALMLRQTGGLADYHASLGDTETSLDELFESLSPNKWLEDKIRNAVLSEEEIADTASSELMNIRRKIARASLRIRESLDKMIRSSEVQKSLMDSIVTVRDGRYVLPVKAEHKGNVRGIVHAASATGSTLFIEPEAVVEANNDIRVLQGQEQEEIERIIAELSADCAACGEAVMRDYETAAEINLYFAKAELGAKMKGCIPEISDDGELILRKARHPLIDPEKVVPVDLAVGRDYNALIVTGPNTGGKTVLLKTAGLLSAMAMCGMMIPAGDGSKISVFDHILVDIGDMQSIEQSLSTFSSHMGNVSDILKTAGERSLILLDELGSGTDPVEGAALAISIIEEMLRKGSRLMVTTHYQELKMFAIERDNVENASCEFDINSLMPTYRLIIGSPGKSNAFYISSRLGIPGNVIDNARKLVSDENRRFEEVVEKLEKSRLELDKQSEELRKLKQQHRELMEAAEKSRREFEEKKDAEFEKARTEAMRIVESCRMQSQQLLDELSDIRKEQNREQFEKRSIAAKSASRNALNKMFDEANPVRREQEEYKPPRPYRQGDRVMVKSLGQRGIIAGKPDGSDTVYVQVGIMKTKVNVTDLRLIEEEKPAAKSTRKGGGVSKTKVTGKMERKSSLELDIRGNAVDEGIMETDRFIDNAVLTGASFVTIIHGKGTGLLRQGIQQHLRCHPSVKSFRSGVFGEGEDGVTIVELK